MFDRIKIIEGLVDADFQYIMSGDGAELLNSYLEFGFKGYNDFTDEELIAECEQRDISYLFGDDDDGQPDEYTEWMDFDPEC